MPKKTKIKHEVKYKKNGDIGEIEIIDTYQVDLTEYDIEIAQCDQILTQMIEEKTEADQETLDFWNANVSALNKKRNLVIGQKEGLQTEKDKFK